MEKIKDDTKTKARSTNKLTSKHFHFVCNSNDNHMQLVSAELNYNAPFVVRVNRRWTRLVRTGGYGVISTL